MELAHKKTGFRYLDVFEKEHPELADYFDMKYMEVSHGGIYGRGT